MIGVFIQVLFSWISVRVVDVKFLSRKGPLGIWNLAMI